MNGAARSAVSVSSHAKHLPSRQTAPCGAVSARTALDLRLQDVRCCDQRCLGRLLIALQLSPCGFKQLGRAVRNEVELLVGSRRRIWCGSLKSFHNQFPRLTIRRLRMSEKVEQRVSYGSLINVME